MAASYTTLLDKSKYRVSHDASRHRVDLCSTPSKRPSDEVIYARQAKAAKQNHASQQTCVVRSGVPLAIDDSASTTSSVPSLIPRDWAPINAAHLERQNHLRATASPDAFGNLPLRSSTSEADQDAPPRPSLVDATAGSVNEEENLYEATPRPERRAIQSGFFRPFARMPVHDTSVPPSHQPREHPDQIQQEQRLCADITDRLQRDSPAIRQESTPAADRETAHAPSHRFRYFITVSWTPGQNIVMLDDTMDVQLVYTRVQRTLRRKLEGRDVGSLSFFIQDEEPIDVEIDDGDAWETVVDMLKDAGLFAVKGAVLRSD